MRKYAVLGAVLLAAAACQDATSPRDVAVAPARVNAVENAAPNDYIVTFRDDESDPDGQANALVQAHGGSIRFVYRNALKGFAVANLPEAAVGALAGNPRVTRVERDGIVTADGSQSPTPSWGLDRIDAATGLNSTYTWPNDGTGVTAYIIDTGLNSSSADFTGRIGTGNDFVDANPPDDCNGHGTHVAGTVGGTKYGVAKNVTVVAVRVLNCQGSGTTSGVIAGIDWVAGRSARPAVANMSLGGGFSQSLNDAVTRATTAGIVFVVAAGNSSANACNYSPSSTPSAITVGATTSGDALASYSNFGGCVDINAPGSGITSDWIGGSTATNTISGTSMASPHVAGAAALYLAANPSATVASVAGALVNNATNGVLGGIPTGTPNNLLYVGFIGAGTIDPPTDPPTEPPPSVDASFTVSCSGGFTCAFAATTTNASSYQWNFGDGSALTTTTSSTAHAYAQKGGSYTATLTISGVTSLRTVSCNPKKGCK